MVAGMLLLFTLCRLFFLLWHYDQFPSGGWSGLPAILAGGIWIDLSVIALISAACFLFSRLFFFLPDTNRKVIFNFLFRTAFVFSSLLLISDTFYFTQFGTRMNVMAMNIMEDPGPILQTILESFPVFPVLLASLVLGVLFFLISRNWSIRITRKEKAQRGWSALLLLTCAVCSFLYLPEPLWTYLPTSNSGMLNQAALNGYYSFFRSIHDQGMGSRDIPIHGYMKEDEAFRITHSMLGYKPGAASAFPFLRTAQNSSSGPAPDFVIILLESFGSNLAGIKVNGIPLTSNFDRWKKEGMLFGDFYANGPRTHHGVISALSGFPSVLGGNLARRKGTRIFHTLADVLRTRSYTSAYWHSGEVTYDDLDLILKGSFDKVYGREHLSKIRFENKWGACDEDLYQEVLKYLKEKKKEPRLTVLMTTSNHLPYDIPPAFRFGHPEMAQLSPMEQGMYYSDHALGAFLDSCSRLPNHPNTYYFICGDHAEMYKPSDSDLGIFHIPLLILGPGITKGESPKTGSQADIAPTVVSLVPGTTEHHFIGRSLLDSLTPGFAFCKGYLNDIIYKADSLTLRYQFDKNSLECFLPENDRALRRPCILKDAERDELKIRIRAYLQSVSAIYRTGKHRIR